MGSVAVACECVRVRLRVRAGYQPPSPLPPMPPQPHCEGGCLQRGGGHRGGPPLGARLTTPLMDVGSQCSHLTVEGTDAPPSRALGGIAMGAGVRD